MRVLLVHPDAATRGAIAKQLTREGHEVVEADSGERAIDLFVQRPTEAMVVDLDLPGRDGAATIESIRWAPDGDAIPIVLTGTRAAPDEVEALAGTLGTRHVADGDPPRIAALLGRGLVDSVTREVPTLEERFDDDLSRPPAERPRGEDPDAHREGDDVERRARAVARAALRAGRLERLPFPRLLTRLAESRATGALVVTSEHDPRPTTTSEAPKKVVFFRNGVPVHVRSNLVDECLGQLLRRQGQIDDAILRESLERVRDGDGRQGGILVALGALSPRQLRDALETQQEEKLLDLFGWSSGGFAFTRDMRPPPETVTLEMGLAETIYRGVRERVPPERVEAALAADADRYVVPLEPTFRGLLQVVGADGHRLLGGIDGTHTLGSLVEATADRDEARRVLWSALCLGAVTLRAEATAVRWDADADPPGSDTAELVRRLVPLLREGRYAEAVEVSDLGSGAAPARIDELRARLRAFIGADDTPPALKELASEALARLLRAETLLVDGDAPTRTPQASDPAKAGANADPPTEPAARDIPPTRRADEARCGGPSPTTASPPLEAQAETAGPAPVDAPAGLPTEPGHEDLDDRVARMLEAERHFRRGVRALRRGRFGRASEAFSRAVELVPTEGEFVAHLSWARFQEAVDDEARREALHTLEQACAEIPKSDRAQLFRARALRRLGDLAAARNAYERCLSANPSCQEALDELRELS